MESNRLRYLLTIEGGLSKLSSLDRSILAFHSMSTTVVPLVGIISINGDNRSIKTILMIIENGDPMEFVHNTGMYFPLIH